jgi:spermidine synthase
VFSIAQFYHFAFLVISLALLGFGASGSMLAIWPRLADRRAWPWLAMSFAAATLAGYLVVDHLAFDSYRIVLEPGEGLVLVLDLVALALPFLFAGAVVGGMLRAATERSDRTYAANLLGSAAGAVVAPLAIGAVGSALAIVLCAGAGAGAGLLLADRRAARTAAAAGLGIAAALLVASPDLLDIVPSPYKRIATLSLDPATRTVATMESPTSRLDIVEAPTIHSAPGLSLGYQRPLPAEAGLVIDGDTLLPVLDVRQAPAELADALPISVALAARPGGRVLFLGSGGGIDAWAALARGAREVTVVEPNPLVLQALVGPLRERAGLAGDPRVRLVEAEIRTFASAAGRSYDVVELALTDAYRPISAGAFTLSETYTLTVEAVRDYLRLAGPDGLLVITRWLQEPPSESARTLATTMEALGDRPAQQHIVAFRSFQTITVLAKATPFSELDTGNLLEAVDARRYDIVLAPRIPPGSVNRYALLPEPADHQLALELAGAADRAEARASALDIAPRPTIARFFQFFRWEQTPAVLRPRRRWQPPGGSGTSSSSPCSAWRSWRRGSSSSCRSPFGARSERASRRRRGTHAPGAGLRHRDRARVPVRRGRAGGAVHRGDRRTYAGVRLGRRWAAPLVRPGQPRLRAPPVATGDDPAGHPPRRRADRHRRVGPGADRAGAPAPGRLGAPHPGTDRLPDGRPVPAPDRRPGRCAGPRPVGLGGERRCLGGGRSRRRNARPLGRLRNRARCGGPALPAGRRARDQGAARVSGTNWTDMSCSSLTSPASRVTSHSVWTSPGGPIGMTIRPPGASWSSRGEGRWSGAAVTTIASYGPWSGQPK